jgi:tetratricopeptide (TPR) repeat protein
MEMVRTPSAVTKPGRNDPCSCGSGKKYKKCCATAAVAECAPRLPDFHDQYQTSRSNPRPAPPATTLAPLIAHISAGRHVESETVARALLSQHPNAGVVWKLLARSLWMQHKDCTDALIRATALLPEDAEAHSSLGNAFRAAGRLSDAITSHRRALAINPNYPDAHNNLGTALRDLGRLEEAAASYQRAIDLKGDFAMAHANLGKVLMQLGRVDTAAACFRRAADLAPGSADNHDNLGDALRTLGLYEAAIASYRQALAVKPDIAEVHNKLANAFFFAGRDDDAAGSCMRALQINPQLAEVHSNLGMLLMRQNRIAQAEASCRRALEIDPTLTGAMVLLAELRASAGHFSEAEECLRRAIELEPDMPEAWAGLVRWRKMSNGDQAWLAAAQRIVSLRLPPRREVHLRYALGKYFDDTREFDKAFDNYRRANELTRQHNEKYDAEDFSRYVDRLVESYDRQWLDRSSARAISSERPVFIVGMWRSGTTLAEQILASHPAVVGAGELAFWRSAATTYEQSVSHGDSRDDTIARLARDYLALLEELSADAMRVIDKMSSNFLHLGLIHAALPHARILHLRRNPIDTCLSIYFQDFQYAHLYANDLEDLVHYYQQYMRVMEHWRRVLPSHAMLEVPYEDLVEDQDHWSRAILEFVGLPWDARCIDFHRTSRTVTTNSKWQVRQVLSNTSVERWRNYERFIAPLMKLAPS